MEQSVRQTLEQLEVRGQVEACMKDLLHDVEAAERWTARVRHECLVRDLVQQGQGQALSLAEERLLRQQQTLTHR